MDPGKNLCSEYVKKGIEESRYVDIDAESRYLLILVFTWPLKVFLTVVMGALVVFWCIMSQPIVCRMGAFVRSLISNIVSLVFRLFTQPWTLWRSKEPVPEEVAEVEEEVAREEPPPNPAEMIQKIDGRLAAIVKERLSLDEEEEQLLADKVKIQDDPEKGKILKLQQQRPCA